MMFVCTGGQGSKSVSIKDRGEEVLELRTSQLHTSHAVSDLGENLLQNMAFYKNSTGVPLGVNDCVNACVYTV